MCLDTYRIGRISTRHREEIIIPQGIIITEDLLVGITISSFCNNTNSSIIITLTRSTTKEDSNKGINLGEVLPREELREEEVDLQGDLIPLEERTKAKVLLLFRRRGSAED